MSVKNLFNIDPLFDTTAYQEQADPRHFDFAPLGASDEDSLVQTGDMSKELREIDERAARKVDELRDKGPLSRYPTILTEEDERRERARLDRRGLKPKEVDRRIAKFKKKGGKVKTSARMMQAAGMLAGGIQGYLAVKGHAIQTSGGIADRVMAEGQARLNDQVAEVNRISEQEKAVLVREDEREWKQYLEELKADVGLQKSLDKEARILGIQTKGKSLFQVADEVTSENARQGELEEDLAIANSNRQQWQTAHNVAEDQLKTAIRSGDLSQLPDEVIGRYFDIDTKDQGALDRMRSSLETAMKQGAFEDAEDLLYKMQRRELVQRELDEEPTKKQTPKERQAQAVETAAQKDAAIAMQKAERAYTSDMPVMASMYWGLREQDQTPEGKAEQAQIIMAAAAAKQKATGLPLAEAKAKVLDDFEDVRGMME